MRYQHSLEIHERLETVLRLIRTGEYSTPALAAEIRVSIPTISRIVAALKARGHVIRAERHDGAWRYVIEDGRIAANQGNRPYNAVGTERRSGHAHD
jgi:CTP-dependent riboflavin kinase